MNKNSSNRKGSLEEGERGNHLVRGARGGKSVLTDGGMAAD